MHGSRCYARRASLLAVVLLGLAATACKKGDDDGDGDPDGGGGPTEEISVHGTATYDFVPSVFTPGVGGGLDFDDAEARPVRFAVVQVLDGATVVASTTTDEDGAYTLTFEANPDDLIVAVLARTVTPSIEVEDNTDGDAVWGMSRALADAEDDGTLDLHATHGWTGTGFDPATRVAAPFAILDTMYTVTQAFTSVRTVSFPALAVNWSPDNVPQNGNVAAGQIGTSHYSSATGEIFVLGKDGVDTDEFDSHVIAHEWTHYFEDQLARSDSPGGPHSGGDVLDPRLAFGEGLGNAIAGMSLADPLYVDTLWSGEDLSAFGIDSETQPSPSDDTSPGPFSELGVNRILYDLFDSGAGEAHDGVALGLGPIYDVLVGAQRTTSALTTIGSFITGLRAQAGVNGAAVDTLLAYYDVGAITNEWGAGDADLAGMYTTVSTIPYDGTHELIGGEDFNKRDQNQYFVFTGTGGTLELTASHADYDVGITLYREGTIVGQADELLVGAESFTASTQAGVTYVLVLTGFRDTAGGYEVDVTIEAP